MLSLNFQQKLHYTLRYASAMCFIGHGAFGIITKPIWCNYFAVFGIGKAMSYHLMPWLGGVDILFGTMLFIYPIRIIPLWLVGWGIFTAILRPLSCEPFAEFIERAGNFGAPLGLLILSGGFQFNIKDLLKPVDPDIKPDVKSLEQIKICLRAIVFLLLAGHGWLNLIEKKGLLGQYAMLGFNNPGSAAQLIGIFEITAAITVLIKPIRPILLIFLFWKIGSELFYPHYELFEWIERGGSYGTILALWIALGAHKAPSPSFKNITRLSTQ